MLKRNKAAYENYVCPECFNTIDRCTCELFPPYHLIFIDKNIQEHIRILNNKGYRTMYCCEGHNTSSNTYISFAADCIDENNVPEGFKYDKKNRIIEYLYSSKLSIEEFEERKREKLTKLLEWCKSLPLKIW